MLHFHEPELNTMVFEVILAGHAHPASDFQPPISILNEAPTQNQKYVQVQQASMCTERPFSTVHNGCKSLIQ